MIAMRENADFERYCAYALGKYVQDMNETDHANTNTPRVLDCLFSGSRESYGYDLLYLHTNKIID